MLEILPIPALRDNYIWLMRQPGEDSVAIVDPGESEPVLNYLGANKLNLSAILVTHHHWDHTSGIRDIIKKYKNATVYGSTLTMDGNTINYPLADNQSFPLEGPSMTFQSIPIPGHTLDHTAYYHPGILFSGDTLFAAGCGKLFEGTAEQMLNSLTTLSTYPKETKVYCGHEYTLENCHFAHAVEPDNQDIINRLKEMKALRDQQRPTLPSTIEIERQTNPFLRTHVSAVHQAAEEFSKKSLTNSVEVFAAIRQWKNQFKLH